ncbi:hypothetical protein TraAM80_01845 [Trypanosoma rangeli]|uniref:Uncharacterized protein n=1 Tax=Trypanosoma rangeli TaxID=5698 RepID=A0A3R7KLX9_TRYRA|nr:uncharacterized protein TraAM80_01845 [Trypanosoma rangeli]RNF10096.1 hypothetical protein TraAM80_01845 [Trypanosoma rangeli]|eukprot:RNF10096.1 hypothetical protein TraAM80_01845 [Trypanosoma rangeli]
MPRLLTFANGVQSRGEGFIKSPASGMWQCTLLSGPLPQECGDHEASASALCAAAETAWMGPQPQQQQRQRRGKKEDAILLHPRSSLLPLQFQLISVSSKYLCSLLVNARPHPLSEVHIFRLDKIKPGTKLPDTVTVAFASATEATWADLLLFMQQAAGIGGAGEATHTAVWRLNWVAPAESGISVGAAFLWRVTEALPLCGRVQDAATEANEEATMHIAVVTAKEGAVYTPPGRAVPMSEGPPPLPPKQTHRETSPDGLPQRDLSAAFMEAQREAEVSTASAEDESMQEVKSNPQPTYAEILVRGIRQRRADATTSAEQAVREWRQRLITLRKQLYRGLCMNTAPRIARDQISLLQKEEQQPCHSTGAKVMALLLKTGMQEMLCDVLFDAAACLLMGGERSRGANRLLQECATTARTASEELGERKDNVVAALQFSHGILQLRLLRHRCYAAALLGQPVTAAMLHEALREQKQVMTLLQGECAGAVCPGGAAINVGDNDDDDDGGSAGKQLAVGVLTAALSLMEMSLLVRKSGALCDDMTSAAGSLLLWLRDTSGGPFELPVALLAQLEERVAASTRGRLHGMHRRCKVCPAARGSRDRGKTEFCCGVVRAVPCSAVFDHQFARTRALIRVLEAATAARGSAGGMCGG